MVICMACGLTQSHPRNSLNRGRRVEQKVNCYSCFGVCVRLGNRARRRLRDASKALAALLCVTGDQSREYLDAVRALAQQAAQDNYNANDHNRMAQRAGR